MQVDCIHAEELVDTVFVTVGDLVIEVGVYSSSVYEFVYRALNPLGNCWTTLNEAINEVAPQPDMYPMVITAEAILEGNPAVDVHIGFTINGVSKNAPYAEILNAGRYNFVFPLQITYEGKTYTLLGNNEFYIDHPANGETFFKASYFSHLPPPPPPPPNGNGWTVTKPLHAFDNVEVFCNLWNQFAGRNQGIFTDIPVLIGGRIRYSITYTRGTDIWPVPYARIYWNEQLLVELQWNIAKGTGQGYSFTGSVDLPQILQENEIKIVVHSSFGGTAGVVFDVWVDLGYSEEPSIDPESKDMPFDLLEWIKENALLAGVLGVGAVLLITRGGTKFVVVKGD